MSIHDDPPRDDTDNARCECGRFIPCRHCPTPIDPADIRPGDVVERRNPPEPETFTIESIAPDGCLIMVGNGLAHRSTDGYSWHLVSRPDPDAEAVEAVRSASYNIWFGEERLDPLPGLRESADLLNKLRESGWDVARRAES